MQKVKDCLTFKKPLNIGQLLILFFSLLALITRLCITEKELMAEFCLLFSSIIVCDMITMCYDRGYYAKSVFEDSHPRKAFVDSPEQLSVTHLKSKRNLFYLNYYAFVFVVYCKYNYFFYLKHSRPNKVAPLETPDYPPMNPIS